MIYGENGPVIYMPVRSRLGQRSTDFCFRRQWREIYIIDPPSFFSFVGSVMQNFIYLALFSDRATALHTNRLWGDL